MNYTFFFLCCSLGILVFSLVVVCISPIINNATKEGNGRSWSISSWRTLNCEIYADKEKSETAKIDDIQKFRTLKNLCYKRKAMHDLEYAFLVINIVLGFVCANLSLLHYFNVGKDFEKKTGLIGLITGIIGFILTLVYICYNGDIFNNDIAYGDYDLTNDQYTGPAIYKKFPNGAYCKHYGTNGFISAFENDKGFLPQYIRYKDLGKKEYNYDDNYYKVYSGPSGNVNTISSSSFSATYCAGWSGSSPNYIFSVPETSNENKDLYDRWLTTLILSIIIDICCIGLSLFGFLLFKSSKGDSSGEKTVPIN